LKRSLSIAGSACLVLLALALPAFAQQAGYEPDTRFQEGGWWFPEAASDYSGRIDYMYRVIFVAVAFMFLLTEGLLIAFCILYRRRPGHRPTYIHGSNKAELVWTVIPALMLLGIAVWQIPHWNVIKRDGFPKAGDPNVTVVDIMGEQFKWHFRYPGSKAKLEDAKKDVNTTGIMRVPLGDAVLCNLRSKDVIHSVFIPLMRVKQDTVPGLRQRLWFRPNRMKLIDLKAATFADPEGYKTTTGQVRTLQPVKWAYIGDKRPDDKSFCEKDFEAGGLLFEKKIALSDYAEVEGFYDVIKVKATGQSKKVRILEKGQVKTGDWKDCDYAVGIVEIACAELCGQGHYTMRSQMYVEPRAAFKNWLQEEADSDADVPAFKFWID
jgi:cytochrome c oxidase subunit 2